ncbi:phage tail spike protein [Ruminococcus flavefaciens]|uniref:Phage minor structural protein n=1 Tax=Ruminococcus flavefaciens TaxID=1265 RepID=A0A315Y2Y8_RUMFL|nr:phage tail spike protein [Ruminococcus flavefaciens]PWJ14600.1 phage minor structural protein [Ruminococcus flavefaciens]SSA42630.1 phage minor structural protein, N-terminal region [Ruminococcus flavefaciens]
MYTISAINGSSTSVIHANDPDSTNRLSAGKFADEVNAIPGFSFNIPAFNPAYNELHDRTTIISIHNDKTGEVDFEGPLIHSKEDVTSAGKVYKSCSCEGYLTYLNDSIQPYHHYESSTVTEFLTALLDYHNSVTPTEKHITLGSCDFSGDNTNSKTTSYRNTLEEIKVNLIERIGGEIRIRKVNGALVLDFLHQYGVKSDTTVELAKNIYSLSVDTDSSNIITRLVPLGAQLNDETSERLTISEVNDGLPYIDDAAAIAKYGIIMGTVTFDDITVASNLKQRGQEYLTNNNRVKKGYAAQVLDLSLLNEQLDSQLCIRAGNTYHFKHNIIGLDEDLRVMKCSVDIFKPYKPEVQIGDKAESITSIATRTASLIEYELPKQRIDILASAKATATALIEAGINGYVVVNGNEILIMDTPNKETATKVWRWNSGGFGYSNNGYSGPYSVAMTMDGAIVADFITAGVLRGIEITNGNGFHVDPNGIVTAKAIDINNGNGAFHVFPNGAVTATAININNGNGVFYVAPDGTVRASAINITGGSINIETNSESFDVISLSHHSDQYNTDWVHTISPLEWKLENTDIDCKVVAQAGAINFYSGSTITAEIQSNTGDVLCHDVKMGNSQGGFGSLRAELDGIWAVIMGN